MLKERRDEGLSDALFRLVEEEDKKRPSALLPLLVLLISGLSLSFLSFFFYKEENEGTLTFAREAIAEFLEENETISVFLGLSDEAKER